MTEWIKALIYGIVEGVTEWLPISSTGHLILLERALPLNMSDSFGSVYRVVIQLGAMLAALILFWTDLWPWSRQKGAESAQRPYAPVFKLWGYLILAMIPTGVIGVLLDDWSDQHFYNALSVSIALILVGILFLLAEKMAETGKTLEPSQTALLNLEDLSWKQALMIGLIQSTAAVFPGVSRSGATILGGLLLGLSRPLATRFSFLLGIPVLMGASFFKLLKFFKQGLKVTGAEATLLIIGMTSAFLISLVVLQAFIRYIQKHNFKPFALYRIGLGVLVLIVSFCG